MVYRTFSLKLLCNSYVITLTQLSTKCQGIGDRRSNNEKYEEHEIHSGRHPPPRELLDF